MIDYEELISKSSLTSYILIVKLAKKGTVNSKVLDVGCGTGIFWKVLGNKVKQELVPECMTVEHYCITSGHIGLLPRHCCPNKRLYFPNLMKFEKYKKKQKKTHS